MKTRWRAKNREKINARVRRWKAKNREKYNAKQRAWHTQSRDLARAMREILNQGGQHVH
jgi:uncharacterized protein YukE